MQEPSAFDHLVHTLSRDERKSMLDAIHGMSRVDTEPLVPQEEEEGCDLKEHYGKLPFWKRLFLYIKALLTSTDKYELLEENLIRFLARSIEESAEALIDYDNGELGPLFDETVGEIRAFRTVLHLPFTKIFGPQKSDFIAFLVGWTMPLLQEELLSLLDPANLAFEQSLEDPQQVRLMVEGKLEELLASIDDGERKRFYRESRALALLKKLVDFPLESLTGRKGFREVKKHLYEFNTIIHSLDPLPEEDTLKALFMFNMEVELQEKDFDPSQRIRKDMDRANGLFRLLRRFLTELRLNDLCKVAGRNLNFRAGQLSGGEDWFRQYRDFWEKRVAAALNLYSEREKRDRVVLDAAAFLGKKNLPFLEFYRSGTLPMEMQPAYQGSLSFINSFVKERFLQELHSPLKLVLIDGQFYKDQNREEYNESYSSILKSVDEIRTIDASLTGESKLRNDIEIAAKEMLGSKIVRKRIKTLISELERDAERVVTTFLGQMQLMINVIGGIVDGEMGGRYDTLSNLGYIGKNDNRNLLGRLRDVRKVLEMGLGIAKSLYEIERNIDR